MSNSCKVVQYAEDTLIFCKNNNGNFARQQLEENQIGIL